MEALLTLTVSRLSRCAAQSHPRKFVPSAYYERNKFELSRDRYPTMVIPRGRLSQEDVIEGRSELRANKQTFQGRTVPYVLISAKPVTHIIG